MSLKCSINTLPSYHPTYDFFFMQKITSYFKFKREVHCLQAFHIPVNFDQMMQLHGKKIIPERPDGYLLHVIRNVFLMKKGL